MSQSTRICADCNIDISARHWRAQRCELCATARYQQQGAAKRTRTMYDHTCEWCSKNFCVRVKHQRFCGDVCSGLASHPGNVDKICVVCDRLFTISRQYERATCSRPCTKWDRKRPGEKPPTRCFYCGDTVNRQVGALYCTPSCNTLANLAVRRARKRNLPAELISSFAVFERDSWVCHLCKRPVDPGLLWPGLQSPSLDHIIPISMPKCPGHVWENVALAHLGCNLSKHDRVRPEDWALYAHLKEMTSNGRR